MRRYSLTLFLLSLISSYLYTDNFTFNTLNNHGVLGLVNMPTARFYDESAYGITVYDGEPDQKITFTSFPFDWLEASFFYSNIQDKPYCNLEFDPVCDQDYKDKGFNFKLRLKEEGVLPAIAIGINDIGGTGLYSSEYIVGSYGINKTDLHFGLGWGALNGASKSFKNPLGYIDDGFYDRPDYLEDKGGQLQPSRYFSGENVSPFIGVSHALNDSLLFKLEYDSTLTPGQVGYKESKEDFSFGFDYSPSKNMTISISSERGNSTTIRFTYKNNPKESRPVYKYKKTKYVENDDKYSKFIKNLRNNGLGVNKLIEGTDSIGIEITQFKHPTLDIIDDIIQKASRDAGIEKKVKKDLRIADLKAKSEFDESFERNSRLIYQRETKSSIRTNTNLAFRPFLASREEFFKGALMLENNTEFIIKKNFFFTTNIQYSLADNFDDLKYPPVNTYPAQVRSDVKDYLKNYGEGIFLGRAQFDYHISPKENHHIMATAGILEEMFNGAGFEYLYFKQESNYSVGFELFKVKKRDYRMRFGTLEYENVVGHINFYYRNYDYIPFDAKISYGEYLAGDEGVTIDLSRSFKNGTKFGVFATFTDVSSEQFGEGSFDKGIYFKIPVFGDLVNYSWRPLTKDPGAKLVRKHTLHDLLVKFRPIN